jgi:single-strand DNA-binding protein
MSNFTIEGFAGTTPRFTTTDKGLSIASFRVAVNHRKYDTSVNQWVATDTSWYTVTAFGVLAEQVERSVTKGDAVIVSGELKIRNWENNGRSGSNAEVVASGIGLNLLFGDTQKVSSTPKTVTAEATLFEVDEEAALVGSPRPADAEWTEENIPF